MRKLYNDARAIFGLRGFSLQAVSTEIISQTMYNPGGVLSLVNGGVKGRILAINHNPYRRWTSTTYRQNCGVPLTIIVTYQVVTTDPQRAGPTTYATQLFALYTKEGRPNPMNLRQHHTSNLVELVKDHQARGEWIIIAGDMNKVLGAKAGGMT